MSMGLDHSTMFCRRTKRNYRADPSCRAPRAPLSLDHRLQLLSSVMSLIASERLLGAHRAPAGRPGIGRRWPRVHGQSGFRRAHHTRPVASAARGCAVPHKSKFSPRPGGIRRHRVARAIARPGSRGHPTEGVSLQRLPGIRRASWRASASREPRSRKKNGGLMKKRKLPRPKGSCAVMSGPPNGAPTSNGSVMRLWTCFTASDAM